MREHPIVVARAFEPGGRSLKRKRIPEQWPFARDAGDASVAPSPGHLKPKVAPEGTGDAARTETTTEEEQEDGDECDEEAEW